MAKKSNKPSVNPATQYLGEFSIGLRAFAITAVSILTIQLARGTNYTESFDKAIFGIALLTAFSLLLIGSLTKNIAKAGMGSLILFIVTFLLGVGGIEKHQPINGVILSNRLWLGFGPFVLVLSLLFIPVIFRLLEWKSLSVSIKAIIASITFANLILVIPSFWQNSASVIDPDHSEYVINEMFGPLNGNWPYSDYIPQYQTFYGFFFKPFLSGASAIAASNTFLVFLTLLSYLTIAIGVFLSWQGLQKRSWVLALALTVPFMGITQFPTREGYLGSIAALLSGLSIRIFPGILLFLAAFYIRFNRNSNSWYLALGVLGGLVSWQSQDFGIAAVVSIGFVILVSIGFANPKSYIRASIYSGGLLIGLSSYPVVGKIFGHSIDMSYFLYFARQFGSGFGAEGMRSPGPVLFILPLIVFLFVLHGVVLSRSRNNDLLVRSSYIGFFMATWSMLGFTYYLNRSYASGQMQVLFLPIAISVASMVGVFNLNSDSGKVFSNSFKDQILSAKYFKEKRIATLIPIASICSVMFATILLTPNPAVEFKRINEGAKLARWPKATILASVEDAAAAKSYADSMKISIAFFGASSQYIEQETGVKSASILNSPFDLMMSQQTVTTSCNYIFKLNPDALVVSDEGQQLFRFENQTLCNRYQFADAPGVRQYHYAVRI